MLDVDIQTRLTAYISVSLEVLVSFEESEAGEGEQGIALPKEPIHRITRPIAHFLHIEAASGGVLLACTAIALLAATSESVAVTNAQIEAVNKLNGTNIKPGLKGIPFRNQP